MHLELFPLLYFTHDVENVYLSGCVFEGALSQDANKPLPRSCTPLFRSCRLSPPQPIALSRCKVRTYGSRCRNEPGIGVKSPLNVDIGRRDYRAVSAAYLRRYRTRQRTNDVCGNSSVTCRFNATLCRVRFCLRKIERVIARS